MHKKWHTGEISFLNRFNNTFYANEQHSVDQSIKNYNGHLNFSCDGISCTLFEGIVQKMTIDIFLFKENAKKCV